MIVAVIFFVKSSLQFVYECIVYRMRVLCDSDIFDELCKVHQEAVLGRKRLPRELISIVGSVVEPFH